LRGDAFIQAKTPIFHALKKQSDNFLASIGMGGSFKIVNRNPKPMRKFCDPRDWESYRRVCESEGIIAEEPKEGNEEERSQAQS